MRLTGARLKVIDTIRCYGPGTTQEIADRLKVPRRRVTDCVRGMVRHKAVFVDGGVVDVTTRGYMLVGSFPPKREGGEQ